MGGGNRNLTPKRRRKKLTEQEKRTKMETKILKLVPQGEAFAVQSQKAESGQTMKWNIVRQEMGGSKYETQYAASMLGNVAGCRFTPGDRVVVALRFSTREYNGAVYQDILVTDIAKI